MMRIGESISGQDVDLTKATSMQIFEYENDVRHTSVIVEVERRGRSGGEEKLTLLRHVTKEERKEGKVNLKDGLWKIMGIEWKL